MANPALLDRTSWTEKRPHNGLLPGLKPAARAHFTDACLTIERCAAENGHCRRCRFKQGCRREFENKGTARIAARKLDRG